ncbi:ParA family protein [Priestia aryabhattai]|uniref:ParA family protein n=1 Tax=Priestia aryabhattai TaxID=412384 RepID=UPI003D28E127
MTRIFSTVMNKGGSLKTSITVNIASQLSLKGYKVLVIDLDEQCNVLLSFQRKNAPHNINDFLVNNREIEDVVVNVSTGLDVINGPNSGFTLESEIRKKKKENPLFILEEKLEEIKGKYNFIFLDTPPSLGFSTALALVACNEILIPFHPELYGSSGLLKTIEQVEELKKSLNPDARIKKVIPVKVDKRSKYHKKTIEECEEFLSQKGLELSKVRIWDTKDGINSLFEESRPPILSRKYNKLKQVYKNLTLEVVK